MEPMEGNSLMQLLNNRIFWVCVMAWFVAQAAKVVLTLAVERRLDFRRFFGLGGMPSSHSATVCAMVVATGRYCGVNSAVFAVAAVLSIIVMYDAMGVRYETGEQAKLLNRMFTEWMDQESDALPFLKNGKKLKEMVGHTPIEVLTGAVLGILIGFAMPMP